MRDLSTYFYRYQIRSDEDLKLSTRTRRLKKASQNTTTHLFFDLTDCSLPALHENLFFTHTYANFFLIKPSQYEHLHTLTLPANSTLIIQVRGAAELAQLLDLSIEDLSAAYLMFAPITRTDLKALHEFEISQPPAKAARHWYWDFRPYRAEIKNSITLRDIDSMKRPFHRLPGLELWNCEIQSHFELEPVQPISWQFRSPRPEIKLSVIIPSYNNIRFLTQTLNHLIAQKLNPNYFELIVCEDGGTDHTAELTQQIFHDFKDRMNLKMIYWSKADQGRGKQDFFRAGQARNLAAQYAAGEFLFFLDSDMLTPPNFAEIVLEMFTKYDVIQFQRYHINQSLSLKNPSYESIDLKNDTYIEEGSYWSQLFHATDWMSLPNFWKFTCTYALGIRKADFLSVGRFKKYYVSYGFEDTDLGYELRERKKRFHLVAVPLLHLTAYNHMQYKNSQAKRLKLLRKTSRLFYLQHLNQSIYRDFGNFFSFEKSILNQVRDLF